MICQAGSVFLSRINVTCCGAMCYNLPCHLGVIVRQGRMIDPYHIVFLLGCTGCGKGALGRALAERVGADIVSVDSMKIYRRMDIGTAKPNADVRAAIPHHLIDVVEPSEEFSVAEFVRRAEAAAGEIASRGRVILAVGGTPMYVKALSEGVFDGPSADWELRGRLRRRAEVEGVNVLHCELATVDPAAAERIHRNDLRRIVRALEVYELTGEAITTLQTQWDRDRLKHRCTFIGIRRSLEDQNHRTNMRVKRLIEAGWVDEVRALLTEAEPLGTSARQALGYGALIDHVLDKVSLEDAVEKIKISTRQFAKAQRTWFKRFQTTRWFDVEVDESVDRVADRVLEEWSSLCST